MLLLMQPRIQLAVWAVSAHCQVVLSFLSTSSLKCCSSSLLSIPSSPSLYLCLGLPWPRCRTLHLASFNTMRFTQAYSILLVLLQYITLTEKSLIWDFPQSLRIHKQRQKRMVGTYMYLRSQNDYTKWGHGERSPFSIIMTVCIFQMSVFVVFFVLSFLNLVWIKCNEVALLQKKECKM